MSRAAMRALLTAVILAPVAVQWFALAALWGELSRSSPQNLYGGLHCNTYNEHCAQPALLKLP
jgi:hypothetical protein